MPPARFGELPHPTTVGGHSSALEVELHGVSLRSIHIAGAEADTCPPHPSRKISTEQSACRAVFEAGMVARHHHQVDPRRAPNILFPVSF